MTTFFYLLMAIIPAAAVIASAAYALRKHSEGQPVRKTMRVNVAAVLASVLLIAGCAMGASAVGAEDNNDAAPAAAQTEQQEETESDGGSAKGLGLLAAGLVTGLAGIGGGIAVAAGAPAAIAATSEDPKAFGKALIFVALGESIALYGVVISILILNKV